MRTLPLQSCCLVSPGRTCVRHGLWAFRGLRMGWALELDLSHHEVWREDANLLEQRRGHGELLRDTLFQRLVELGCFQDDRLRLKGLVQTAGQTAVDRRRQYLKFVQLFFHLRVDRVHHELSYSEGIGGSDNGTPLAEFMIPDKLLLGQLVLGQVELFVKAPALMAVNEKLWSDLGAQIPHGLRKGRQWGLTEVCREISVEVVSSAIGSILSTIRTFTVMRRVLGHRRDVSSVLFDPALIEFVNDQDAASRWCPGLHDASGLESRKFAAVHAANHHRQRRRLRGPANQVRSARNVKVRCERRVLSECTLERLVGKFGFVAMVFIDQLRDVRLEGLDGRHATIAAGLARHLHCLCRSALRR
mmetsp:Transcript_8076/g.25706  ORF Transcript_8076/g.25706 Transcript_8076/m.25706 type:complete len:360 (+) Transcript_8076:251-1330(+)